MKIDLSDKLSLVTGSTQGIGFAIAKQLAVAGSDIIVNGRSATNVDTAVTRIGGSAIGMVADVGTADGCDSILSNVPECDILVINAAEFSMSDFFETQDSDWARLWETNVMSGVRLARAYLAKMQAKGWGRCIFIASESAFNVPAEMLLYGVTKTAEVSLARGLAKRMSGTGVTVNSVLPGPTLSDSMAGFLHPAAESSGQTVEEVANQFVIAHRPSSIIRRVATVEEVANLVVYTASQQASATTGAALRVDGGLIESIF